MKNKPIYLDYMATTPIDARVVSAMLPVMGFDGNFGNPASFTHEYGQHAALAVDAARVQIARVVGAMPEEIIFTSGATESNNLAILGAARFYQRKGQHVVTMTTEHQSVLASFKQLEREGFSVTYLNPEADGILKLSTLAAALRPDTTFVSIMHVNNEIGVIQDIASIGQLLSDKGIIFHVDAAQSAGKIPIDLRLMPVHLMSFSAHKVYGPKGAGALFVRQKPRVRIQAQTYGGLQEHGMRAGTLATHQIVGMGSAVALSEEMRVVEQTRILQLRQLLWDGIKCMPGIVLNGSATLRVAGNLNISFHGVDGATLLESLYGIAVSSASACATSRQQGSHVLKALGVPGSLAQASVRLSIGRYTTATDVERAIAIIRGVKL